MTNSIDCSRMSHAACELDPVSTEPEQAEPDAPAGGVSYDCVNDCIASMDIPLLLSGTAAALGCSVLPPACPVIVLAAAGSVLGGCAAACHELESPRIESE